MHSAASRHAPDRTPRAASRRVFARDGRNRVVFLNEHSIQHTVDSLAARRMPLTNAWPQFEERLGGPTILCVVDGNSELETALALVLRELIFLESLGAAFTVFVVVEGRPTFSPECLRNLASTFSSSAGTAGLNRAVLDLRSIFIASTQGPGALSRLLGAWTHVLLLAPWALEIATNQAALLAGTIPIIIDGPPATATAALRRARSASTRWSIPCRATRRCPASKAWFNFPR